ncbi:MAG: hypothetical protein JWM57_487 [Phycisphaerales bacterium]|nr:hypothetical protein [Phycisphaerales bacterium]
MSDERPHEPVPPVDAKPATETKVRKRHVSAHESAKVLMRTLVTHFGDKAEALRFARAFAGIQVRYPRPEMIEQLEREERVLAALQREPTTAVVRRMRETFHVGRNVIGYAFARQNGGNGLKAHRAAMKADLVADGQSDAPAEDDAPERAGTNV